MTEEKKDTEQEKDRLIAMFKGDFYLREGDYQKALEEYLRAKNKEKLVELGEKCLKRGHPKITANAFEVAGEKANEQNLIECAMKCLEWGQLHDGVFAYQWAKRISRLEHFEFVRKYLDRDLFRKCGDAILAKAEKSSGKDRMREDAALAYAIANRPDKIVTIADLYFKEAALIDNAKKADTFYEKAAYLMLSGEEEPVSKLSILFSSEELVCLAKNAAEIEKDTPRVLVGRSKRQDDGKEPENSDVRMEPWDKMDRVNYDFEEMRKEIDELVKPRKPEDE